VESWVAERWPEHRRERMFRLDMFNCSIGAVNLFCLNMSAVFLMLHNWMMFFTLLSIFLGTVVVMHRTWYRNLPSD
jgi:hypothetical protein